MDQNEGPGDLERKIEQATRIASRIGDPTTVERLSAWIQDLRQRLQQRLEARRTKQQISARAQEIWEQNGSPCRPRRWSFGFRPSPGSASAGGNDEARSHRPRDRSSRFSGLPAIALRISVFHAAALSSLSTPRATILIASSGNGRCSALASSHGARIQTFRS